MADAALAAQYQSLANQEAATYNNATAQKGVVDAQIAKLQQAQTDLTTQVNNFQSNIVDKFSGIEANDSSQFQGDRQVKYAEQYNSAKTASTTNKTSHDTNLSSIATKLTELEAQSATLSSQASTAYTNMINNSNLAASYNA